MNEYQPPTSDVISSQKNKKFHFLILFSQLVMGLILVIGVIGIIYIGNKNIGLDSMILLIAWNLLLGFGIVGLYSRKLYGYVITIIFWLLMFVRSVLSLLEREEIAAKIKIGTGALEPSNQGELAGAIFYQTYAPIFYCFVTIVLISYFVLSKRLKSEFFKNNQVQSNSINILPTTRDQ